METTSAVDRRRQLRAGLRDLHRAAPDVMRGFGDLHRAAMSDGAMTSAQKELIALSISVALGCSGCITLHVHDALQAGATRDEVDEAIGVAVMMGGGRATVYGTEALAALADFEAARQAPPARPREGT